MRTSDETYHRILWDPALDPTRFRVGIDVHEEEPEEIPLLDFEPGGEIPWHRVIYFRADDEIVWDRRTKTDAVGRTEAGRAQRR